MPTAYILVGVPASGKSTWAKSQDWFDDCVYVSTDTYVEDEADRQGKTYTEVFKEYMPTAVELMTRDVLFAREFKRDIIWDQTSTTVASRRKKFNMLPNYHKIAVVFKNPDAEEHGRRLAARPGKFIPVDVVAGMIASFEMPTLDEGFDEIWKV